MFNKIKQYWPSAVNLVAFGIIAENAKVQAYAASHIAWSGPILLVWTIFLHWAKSPRAVKSLSGAKN